MYRSWVSYAVVLMAVVMVTVVVVFEATLSPAFFSLLDSIASALCFFVLCRSSLCGRSELQVGRCRA
jgi:hypothetical protein